MIKAALIPLVTFALSSVAQATYRDACEGYLSFEARRHLNSAMSRVTRYPDIELAMRYIVDLRHLYPQATFRDFEGTLRAMNSNVHLLGVPARFAPSGSAVEHGLPYFLWIGVRGAQEAVQLMKHYGIGDHETNRENLDAETGILILSPH